MEWLWFGIGEALLNTYFFYKIATVDVERQFEAILYIRGKRFTVCTEITIILGTVRFTIRGGRLRYKRYDAHFKKKVLNFRFLLLVII
jgi:hypothetical protein